MLRLKVITFAVLLLCGIGMYSHSYIFKNCDLTTQYHSSLPVAPQNYWVCWMLIRLGALLAQSLSKLYTDLQPKFLSSEKFGCRKYISILLLILFFFQIFISSSSNQNLFRNNSSLSFPNIFFTENTYTYKIITCPEIDIKTFCI